MDTRTAMQQRRSIRKFKADEVPEKIVREILEDARWAPSWGNTQPWEIYVVTGEALKRLREANRQKLLEGVSPSPEIKMPEQWPEALKKRYTEVGKSVLTSLSIAREDHQGRLQYNADMYSFFNAPCLILFCIDKSLVVEYAMLDVGLILQTICLLAHNRGLGTCILAASVRYPDVLRKSLKIPENKSVVIGVALGYPDWDSPVNHFARERTTLNDLVTWVNL
ncbi:MAG: nitroreductase [Syntrophales bacterium]|nr:nitroreductase [Syntrophales bacterium]